MSVPPTSTRRSLLKRAALITAANALPVGCSRPKGSNSDIRVGICGFHGKGMHHIEDLLDMDGVRIVALCDVDGRTMDKGIEVLGKHKIKARTYKDYREFCQDKDMDGVIIATPNHSHTLIALTAIANGKHVYVEKPVCHNMMEGRKLVDAAAKNPNLIITHGMQRRSDEGWDEAIAWVKEGHLGKVTLSRGLNYKARESIGKVTGPERVASYIDYDLWCACRPVVPLMRDKLHYDWHWQWAYGNGDIGNQGPHQMDVARWALGQETLPKRVMSLGGRWGYDDDGQTPNNQLAFFPYEPAPLLFDNRGLPMKDMNWGVEPVYKGIRIGNIIHCEGGYVAESKAYDTSGSSVKKFDMRDGGAHMTNWLESIRQGKLVKQNLSITHGHLSAALVHMANISFRLGKQLNPDEVRERLQGDAEAITTLTDFEANLQANGISVSKEQSIVGPWLDLDPATERFTGEFAAEANALIEEEYRKGFELPVI
ncbi:MAG: Gfo/Idh/MocA family oxidoreductase [Verrucomicrobiaceae bacterium]|nr:Gfo/Idh/MocA family oxidoreductase [Verrucomicrobiaceae bacterium]